MPVVPSDWAFADCATTPFPGTPDPKQLCLKDGFDPAYLYELSYTARDPLVLGIGFWFGLVGRSKKIKPTVE